MFRFRFRADKRPDFEVFYKDKFQPQRINEGLTHQRDESRHKLLTYFVVFGQLYSDVNDGVV